VSLPELVLIGLVDPKSPTNVGAVLRAAGCYQANAVRFTGDRYLRAASFQTDTKNVVAQLPLEPVADLLEDLPTDIRVVCVEMVEGAVALPGYQHPPRALYVFGPEDGTLAQALIDRADDVIYVPTEGCMNLAASVNVVLYDRLAKGERAAGDADQLRRTRDTNNRVRVRTPGKR